MNEIMPESNYERDYEGNNQGCVLKVSYKIPLCKRIYNTFAYGLEKILYVITLGASFLLLKKIFSNQYLNLFDKTKEIILNSFSNQQQQLPPSRRSLDSPENSDGENEEPSLAQFNQQLAAHKEDRKNGNSLNGGSNHRIPSSTACTTRDNILATPTAL